MDGEREACEAEERRWDSVRRRWRARSLVARADSVAERGSVGLAEGGWRGVWEGGVGSGGLGVCEGEMLELVLWVRTGGWGRGWEEEGGGYHECLKFGFRDGIVPHVWASDVLYHRYSLPIRTIQAFPLRVFGFTGAQVVQCDGRWDDLKGG